jgi:hydroxymethylglutaryl-CoA lyase
VTAFTSPKAIPALANAKDVVRWIQRVPGVEYAALAPNLRGCEPASDNRNEGHDRTGIHSN